MHLYVKPPEGRVEVSAPMTLSDESIELFVRTKLGWIRKQQEKFRVQPRQGEREYVSGETLYVWGRQYFLQVEHSYKGNSLVLDGDRAILTVRKESTVKQREAFVNEWYRGLLKAEVEKYLSKYPDIYEINGSLELNDDAEIISTKHEGDYCYTILDDIYVIPVNVLLTFWETYATPDQICTDIIQWYFDTYKTHLKPHLH